MKITRLAILLAVTPTMLKSAACLSEWGYARDLQKPILPVQLQPVDYNHLPEILRPAC